MSTFENTNEVIRPLPKKPVITEKEVFGAGTAVAVGVVAYKVAEKVFPIILEKATDIISGLLSK